MKHRKRDYAEISTLFVEDEAASRTALTRATAYKFPAMQLFTAETGKMGLEMFSAHIPDIVVTDVSMPEMDGIEMIGAIRALNPKAKVIVVSAHSDLNYLLDVIKMGVSRYVLKPVNHKQLFEAIESCAAEVLLARQVKRQEEHIRTLSRAVERSAGVVIITDPSGRIQYVNPKFCELTGYTSDEIIGKTPSILKSGAVPPETYTALWETIRAGKEWRGEFLNRKKNGETYWESASISSITDEAGIITHFVAVKEDISARKKAEEEIEILNTTLAARAAELEVANRELEAFNSMVSHDLKSPLTNISGYAQVLMELYRTQLDPQAMEYIQGIWSETERMGGLIRTLLEFSRLDRMDAALEEVFLGPMVESIAADLKMKDPHRSVEFRIASGPAVLADPRLLHVALQNLLGNAWKYTSRIQAALIEFGSDVQTGQPVFFVRDNGVGFPMEKAHRLFQVFQRLHKPSEFEGHGIGLATVNRIMQRLGGKIWAEGEEGKGATFYFSLPTPSIPSISR